MSNINIATLTIEMAANVARLQTDMAAARSTVDRAMTDIKSAAEGARGALEALGVGLSLVAVTEKLRGMIDEGERLNHLSEQMGMTVSQLAKYKLIAEQSGTSLEGIGKGIKKLAVTMLEHREALEKAGVTAKDTDGAMRQLSDLFAPMADGLDKVALATKIFGKSGIELIPMLNRGSAGLDKAAEASARYAAIMTILAPEAHHFNDQLAEIKLNSEAMWAGIAANVIPTLNKFAEQMIEGTRIAGGFWKALWMFGTSNPFKAPGEAIKDLNKQLEEATARQERFTAAGMKTGNLDKHIEDLKKDREFQELLQRQNLPSANYSHEGHGYDSTRTNEIAQVKKAMELLRTLGGVGGSAAATSQYDAIKKSLIEKTAAQEADLNMSEKATVADKEYASFLVAVTSGILKLTPVEMADAATRWDLYLKTANLNQSETEWLKAVKASTDAVEKNLESLKDKIATAELENATYGMTKSQIEAVTVARLEEQLKMVDGFDSQEKLADNLRREIAARKQLAGILASTELKDANHKAAEQAAAEWKRLTDDIERALTDSLMRGFENGKDFGKNFLDSFKNLLKTAALKIVVQPIIDPIMGTVRSALGGGSGATSSSGFGGALSLASNANSAMSLTSLGSQGGAYGSFAASSFGQSLGLSAIPTAESVLTTGASLSGIGSVGTAGAQLTTLGSTGAGIASTLSAAMPYIAAALAAYSLLSKSGGGPKTEGGFNDGSGGLMPSQNQMGGQFASTAQALTAGVAATYKEIVGLFGKTAGNITGGAFVSTDPQGTANTQLFQTTQLNGRVVYDRNAVLGGVENVGRSDAALQAALGASSGMAIISALEATEGLPQMVKKYLDSIEIKTLTAESSAAALNYVRQLNSVLNAFGTLGISADKLTQSLADSFGGMDKMAVSLSSYYTNFYSDAEKNKIALGSISATLKGLGVDVVPQTRAQFRALAEQALGNGNESLYASLIAVSGAFAAITNAAQTTLDTAPFSTREQMLYTQATGNAPSFGNFGKYDAPATVAALRELQADQRILAAKLGQLTNVSQRQFEITDKWENGGMPPARAVL